MGPIATKPPALGLLDVQGALGDTAGKVGGRLGWLPELMVKLLRPSCSMCGVLWEKLRGRWAGSCVGLPGLGPRPATSKPLALGLSGV